MYKLKVKYDTEYKGIKYKIGEIIEVKDEVMLNALTRMGCIFINENAEYKQVKKAKEETLKVEEVKEVFDKPKVKKAKKVRKDVTVQDIQQAEIQEQSTLQE